MVKISRFWFRKNLINYVNKNRGSTFYNILAAEGMLNNDMPAPWKLIHHGTAVFFMWQSHEVGQPNSIATLLFAFSILFLQSLGSLKSRSIQVSFLFSHSHGRSHYNHSISTLFSRVHWPLSLSSLSSFSFLFPHLASLFVGSDIGASAANDGLPLPVKLRLGICSLKLRLGATTGSARSWTCTAARRASRWGGGVFVGGPAVMSSVWRPWAWRVRGGKHGETPPGSLGSPAGSTPAGSGRRPDFAPASHFFLFFLLFSQKLFGLRLHFFVLRSFVSKKFVTYFDNFLYYIFIQFFLYNFFKSFVDKKFV